MRRLASQVTHTEQLRYEHKTFAMRPFYVLCEIKAWKYSINMQECNPPKIQVTKSISLLKPGHFEVATTQGHYIITITKNRSVLIE